jgi:hypothetical protein
MLYVLYALTALAFAAVVVTLIMGAVAMGGRDQATREKSNMWMRRRVTAQVVAIGMLVITVYVRNKSGV